MHALSANRRLPVHPAHLPSERLYETTGYNGIGPVPFRAFKRMQRARPGSKALGLWYSRLTISPKTFFEASGYNGLDPVPLHAF